MKWVRALVAAAAAAAQPVECSVAARDRAAKRTVLGWAAEQAARAAGADAVAVSRFLGAVYEALGSISVQAGPGGPVVVDAPQQRRRAGAYYTPPAVVEALCRRVLDPLLQHWEHPQPPRVLDPAAGCGVFLAGAWQRLSRRFPPAVAAGALYGIDRDSEALAVCRLALDISLTAAGSGPAAVKLRCADTLLETDDWGGFDVCLGNPPYVSSGLRGAPAFEADYAGRLRRRFAAAAQYKLNLYPLFIQRGVELLRPGGRLGFVLPDSFLLGRYFAGLRRFLLATCCIEEITLIEEDFWPGGRVGRTALLVLTKQPQPELRRTHNVRMTALAKVDDLARAPVRTHRAPQSSWQNRLHDRFRLTFSAADAAFLRAVEQHPAARPLSDLMQSYSGLIARYGQQSLRRSAHQGDVVEVMAAGQCRYRARPRPEQWRPLLGSGREIDRYVIAWAGDQVLIEPALIKSGGKAAYYTGAKLLLRQTADALRVAYDDQGFWCFNNMHLLVPRPDQAVDPLFVLACLNSRLVGRYYRLISLESGRLYPQIDLDALAEVPVLAPAGPRAQQAHDEVVGLVRARLALGGRPGQPPPPRAQQLEQAIDAAVAAMWDVRW